MMDAAMNFQTWRNGPARQLLQGAMGFNIDQIMSWQDYTESFGRFFNHSGCPGDIRERFTIMSSGEQVLFAACLCAADFAWLADELTGDSTWQRIWWDLSGDYKTSVGAAIARMD